MKSILIPTTLIGKLGTMIIATLMLLLLLTLNACSTNNQALDNSNNNLGSALSFENASTVPVLDGQATRTGVYIRNNTSRVIQDIKYQLDEGESTIKPGITLNGYQCNRIEANSSCLLGFTTKSLKIGEAGSAMIIAHYTVGGSQPLKSKQLINLRYADTHNCSGIQFGGEVSLFHQGDYATAYAYTCGGKSFNDVGFYALEKSVAVVGDINNGRINMLAQQVLPLEITTGQRVTANNVTVVPFLSHEIGFANMKNDYELRAVLKQQATSKSLFGAGLLGVVITPNTQANLVMSDLSLMTDSTTDQTITVFNNGNRTATSMSMSLPAALTQQSTTCGSTLAANASCNYVVRLSSSTLGNGNVTVTLNYNNGSTATSASQIAYYSINTTEAMVYITANPTSISMNTNESTTVSFTLYNTGGQAVAASPTITLSQNGLTNTLTTSANTCTGGIAVGSSCTITGKVAAGSGFGTGKTFLKVLATSQTSGNTFSFVSPSITTIVNNPNPEITSTTVSTVNVGSDGPRIPTNPAITVNFNTAMNVATLNNLFIQLIKVSTGDVIPLSTDNSGGNQTVVFTLPDGSKLDTETDYKIVVNQTQIKSAGGITLGESTAFVQTTFTTGRFNTPTIVDYQPADGALLQSRRSTVRLTFSTTMTTPNITSDSNVWIVDEATGLTLTPESTNYVSADKSVYKIYNSFESNKYYKLMIDQTQLKSSTTNGLVPLGESTAYMVSRFQTGSLSSPTISSVSPNINAFGVSTSMNETSIKINFSNSMDLSTMIAANFTLKNFKGTTVSIIGTPSYQYQNNVLTLPLTADLLANSTYTLTFNTAAIKDIYGNTLDVSGFNNNSASYSFTTGTYDSTGFILLKPQTSTADSVLGIRLNGESTLGFIQSYAGALNFTQLTYTNANDFLALSTKGLMFYRSTNGASWTAQVTPSSINAKAESINHLYCSPVNDSCFMVGDAGLIYRSTNNGKNWSTATSSTTYDLFKIDCDNNTGQYCVAVGGDGTTGVVDYSADFGQNWSPTTDTTWKKLLVVAYVGTSSRVITAGTAASGNRPFYKNDSNGSGSWSVDNSTTSNNDVTDLSCLYGNYCVLKTSGNVLMRSTDANAGLSWAAISGGTAVVKAVCIFNDPQCSYIRTDAAVGRFALDSGSATAYTGTAPNNVVFNVVAYSKNGNTLSAINANGKSAVVTSASGASFSSFPTTYYTLGTPVFPSITNASNGVGAIACKDNVCVAAYGNVNDSTSSGVFYSSTGGLSWTKVSSLPSVLTANSNTRITDMAFTSISGSSYRFIAITNYGQIVRTTNSGSSWTAATGTTVDTAATPDQNRLSCTLTTGLTSAICIAVIQKSTSGQAIYRSTNDGSSWTGMTTTGTEFTPAGVSCAQENCVVVGSNGKYASFTTSATTYTSANISPSYSQTIRSVKCVGSKCIAISALTSTNYVHISTNSGSSWTAKANIGIPTTTVNFNSDGKVSCSGATCLVVISGATDQLMTDDFGASWYVADSGLYTSGFNFVTDYYP